MKAADVEVQAGEGMPVVHEVANWAAWPVAVQCMRFTLSRLLSEHPGTWVVANSDWDQRKH